MIGTREANRQVEVCFLQCSSREGRVVMKIYLGIWGVGNGEMVVVWNVSA